MVSVTPTLLFGIFRGAGPGVRRVRVCSARELFLLGRPTDDVPDMTIAALLTGRRCD